MLLRLAPLSALSLLLACGAPAPRETKSNAHDDTPSDTPKESRVGDTVSTFTVDRLDRQGEKITIPAPSKLTLINYFGTFCPSSKRWMRELEAMRQRHPEVTVIGVTTDPTPDGASVIAFSRGEGATFPLAWDPDRLVQKRVPPLHYQSVIVLDRHGKIVHTHVGTSEDVWAHFEAKLDALLTAPSS
jgi:hypothetical protein